MNGKWCQDKTFVSYRNTLMTHESRSLYRKTGNETVDKTQGAVVYHQDPAIASHPPCSTSGAPYPPLHSAFSLCVYTESRNAGQRGSK